MASVARPRRRLGPGTSCIRPSVQLRKRPPVPDWSTVKGACIEGSGMELRAASPRRDHGRRNEHGIRVVVETPDQREVVIIGPQIAPLRLLIVTPRSWEVKPEHLKERITWPTGLRRVPDIDRIDPGV